MNTFKLFGLAALATLSLMAIGSAGPASATVLCKVKPALFTPETCPAGEDVPAGETYQLVLKPNTKWLMNTQSFSENIVTCQESELKGKITIANQVEGKLESVLIRRQDPEELKCSTTLSTKVEVIVENLPWTVTAKYEGVKLSQDGTENVAWGKVKFSEQAGKQIQFRIKQGPIVDCLYKTKNGSIEGEVINGTTGASQAIFGSSQSDFEEKEPKKAICPDSGRWIVSYNFLRGAGANVYIAK